MYALRVLRPTRNLVVTSSYGRLVCPLTSGGNTHGLYPLACGIISEACPRSERPLLAPLTPLFDSMHEIGFKVKKRRGAHTSGLIERLSK